MLTQMAAADVVEERVCTRLEFGTAGLRGLMGAGFSRMNAVVVVQTTQGICAHLLDTFDNDTLKRRGVAVGYDARVNSDHFARAAAAVFASKGIQVFLTSEPCPTPILAAAVSYKQCAAGVMVTASHNPKEYNGYKVYWSNGAQIIPPVDSLCAAAIEQNLDIWERPNTDDIASHPLVSDPLAMVAHQYFDDMVKHLHFRPNRENASTRVRVAYTPLHGVGGPCAEKAIAMFGLPPPVRVPAQAEPDAAFPTVTFPNPEEGADTWSLCFQAAEEAGATLALANDPDADRLAAAEWNATTGKFEPFSGNEIGALLGHWVWTEYAKANPDVDKSKCALLCSTVSSKFLGAMARAEGLHFEETLTGFKWLGNRARELEEEGMTVLFCFEEAIGFSFNFALTPDKDGVAAAAVFNEMAAALDAERGVTVREHLASLYERYGTFANRQGYVVRDPAANADLFAKLRASYAREVGGVRVDRVRDMGMGLDGTPDECDAGAAGEPSLPWTKGDLMITYYLEGDAEVTLRASGTEPKLKWYLDVQTSGGADADALAAAVQAELLGV